MLPRWYVDPRYSEGVSCKDINVRYLSHSPLSVFTHLDVLGRANERKVISLTFSPLFLDSLIYVFNQLSLPYQCNQIEFTQFTDTATMADRTFICLQGKAYSANIEMDQEGLKKIFYLFDYFNQKMDSRPFPKELYTELENIFHGYFQPQLSEFRMNFSDTHRKPYHSLSDIYAFEPLSEKHRCYLFEGDNPDQLQTCGSYNALTYAVLRQSSVRAVELLLWYQSNPFLRTVTVRPNQVGGVLFSPLEYAIAFNQTEKANIIVHEFSKITHSIQNEKKENIESYHRYYQKGVESIFYNNHSLSIKTRLMDVNSLTKTEKMEVFDIFKENFSSIHSENIKNEFDEEFVGSKLIDLIVNHQNKIVGFNLFDMVSPKKHPTHLFVHCAYAAIEKSYRGLGLMNFLSFRLPYVIQTFFPNQCVGFFYSALHYNSYRLVSQFKHWPKYQDDQMNTLMLDLIDTIMPEAIFVKENLKTYLIDSMLVNQKPVKTNEIMLNEKMYKYELRADDEVKEESESRSVPVAFLINEENTEFMKQLSHKKGFSFFKHISSYQNNMFQFMKDHPNETVIKRRAAL